MRELILDAVTIALVTAYRWITESGEDPAVFYAELDERVERLQAMRTDVPKVHAELDAILASRKLPKP